MSEDESIYKDLAESCRKIRWTVNSKSRSRSPLYTM